MFRLRELLIDEGFQARHKHKPQDFTRERKLTFITVVIGLINLLNRSLAVELNKLLGLLQGKGQCCSKQAFSQQREKLAPSAFIALNDSLIEEFYRDGFFEHFHGLRLLACDGSTFSLPNTSSVIDYFGVATNQLGSVAMGRASTIYDVLNQLTLSALLKPYKADERSMLFEQLESLPTRSLPSLLLLDRGYPSFLVMALLQKKGLHFIMRLPLSNSFAEALAFAASQEKDAVIDFDLKQGSRQRDKTLQQVVTQLPSSMLRLRLLRFALPSGETEYLISDLTDPHQYPYALFYQAYGLRWAVETQFRVEQMQLEIENFSGKKKDSVLQEFHASILCSNLQAVLALDAGQRRTQKQAGKPLKHAYKINRAVSLGLLKDELLSLLDNRQSLEEAYEQLVTKMQRFVISSPPGRKFPRKRKRKHKNTSKRRRPT